MLDTPERNANFEQVSNGSLRNAAIYEAAWRLFGEPAVLRHNRRQEPWIHIVVCGLARSGTTLIQALLSHPDNGFQVFPDEQPAIESVTRHRVKRPYLLSKKPGDVHRIEQIKDLYSDCRSGVRFILSIRDPRDVLVSRHPGSRQPTEPFVTPRAVERRLLEVIRHQEDENCFILRYENLVRDPESTKAKLSDFIGKELHGQWAAGSTQASSLLSAQSQHALHGPRALDERSIGNWHDHADAIDHLFEAHPALIQLSGMLGYQIES